MEKAEFNDSKEFPEVLRESGNNSIDVLVYVKKTKEHTIGWFNFNLMTWNFLCREAIGKFKWRYFEEDLDTWK